MNRYPREYSDHPYTLSKRAPYTHMREVVQKYLWHRLGDNRLDLRAVLQDLKTVIENALAEFYGGTPVVTIQVTYSPPAPVEILVSTDDAR